MFEAFESQPASLTPIAALRAALRQAISTLTPEEWAEFRETTTLGLTVPEIRARMMDELSRTMNVAADMLAKRTARNPDDLVVRAYAGAMFGVIMSVLMPSLQDIDHVGTHSFEQLDEALALLEAGLPL
jgi:hypothetical protein